MQGGRDESDQVVAGYHTGGWGSTSTDPTVSARGPRGGVNKNFSGARGDVMTLCKVRRLKEVLHILNQPGVRVDSNTYSCLLQECIKAKNLAGGKQVHAHVIQAGFKLPIFVLNTLIKMYVQCGSMVDARRVFTEMPERDMFTWTIMMTGYGKHGHANNSLNIYEEMQQKGVMLDRVTFICALNACASLGALEKGKEVHAGIIKAGIVSYINLENTLVDMYAKCGSMKDACQVFNNMHKRDVVSWNAMVGGYARRGYGMEAFKLYEQMQRESVRPDRVTFISVLSACASLRELEKGKQVHADISKAGIASYINLENSIVNMYAKCGSMKDARQVFDNMTKRDVVSWNVVITGYTQCGWDREAFEIYEKMQQEGVMPDRVTFICILNVCASLGDVEKAKKLHKHIINARIPTFVNLETAVVDMYAKCGSMKDAHDVFDKMATRNVVSWSAMIAGYAQHGCGKEALKIYEEMQREGVAADGVTFIGVLNACASLGALEIGKQVHADIIKAGIASYINLENSLVDMYAKGGSMKDAHQVFNSMAQRDVISWSAMIAGYAQHGCGKEALQLFEQMQREGLKPNGITFLSLLAACSHVGLVDEGCQVFDSMLQEYGLTPTVEHFGCMVDVLGRAGRLDEAEDLINKMPMEPDDLLWRAMLSACRIHGNVELAEHAAKCILEWNSQRPAPSVLLSNIYGVAGRQEDDSTL